MKWKRSNTHFLSKYLHFSFCLSVFSPQLLKKRLKHSCLQQLESDMGAQLSARVSFCRDFLAFPAVVANQLEMAQLTAAAGETTDRT